MQKLATGYRGLGVLFEVNSDRFLLILIILMALAAVGIVGAEYVSPTFVDNPILETGSIV